jgi:DNA repair protein RadC
MDDEKKSYIDGHRNRVKERFKHCGFDFWQEYEILEFALFFVIPRLDTKTISKKLIDKFGSLKQVIDAEREQLLEIGGLGEHSAIFISFLKKFCGKYGELKIKSENSISSSNEAVKYLKSVLSGEKIEKFFMLILNSANKVTECLEIESGTPNSSPIIPRKIAQIALENRAVSTIIAHNHPGGTLKPSQNDISSTNAIVNALNAIDVSLLDHIIISNDNHFSFKENFLI